MDVQSLLNSVKTTQGIETDSALAAALGVTKQAVSNWRRGTKLPDAVACATIAGLTGIPLTRVIGIVGEARAISREEKAVWRKLASAVVIVLALGATALPERAYAAAYETQGVGIMRSAWRQVRGGFPAADLSAPRCVGLAATDAAGFISLGQLASTNPSRR